MYVPRYKFPMLACGPRPTDSYSYRDLRPGVLKIKSNWRQLMDGRDDGWDADETKS